MGNSTSEAKAKVIVPQVPEPDERFDKATGKYFVRHKADWSNCTSWVDNKKHQLVENKFGRSNKILSKYKEHKETVLAKYVSIGDYILIEKMGFEGLNCYGGSYDGKRLRVPRTDDVVSSKKHLFTKNQFPYHLIGSIKHYIIFCVVPLTTDEVDEIIAQQDVLKNGEIIWWVNPPKTQSMPTVWHCQILCKGGNKGNGNGNDNGSYKHVSDGISGKDGRITSGDNSSDDDDESDKDDDKSDLEETPVPDTPESESGSDGRLKIRMVQHRKDGIDSETGLTLSISHDHYSEQSRSYEIRLKEANVNMTPKKSPKRWKDIEKEKEREKRRQEKEKEKEKEKKRKKDSGGDYSDSESINSMSGSNNGGGKHPKNSKKKKKDVKNGKHNKNDSKSKHVRKNSKDKNKNKKHRKDSNSNSKRKHSRKNSGSRDRSKSPSKTKSKSKSKNTKIDKDIDTQKDAQGIQSPK